VDPQHRVPVQADLPDLLDRGLGMVRERLRATPGYSLYLSIQAQLEYLQGVLASAQSPDPEKIRSLTMGVYAAREFETTDPDFAGVLFKVEYLAKRMP
jgi:Tse6 toxin immunity protein Tsi6